METFEARVNVTYNAKNGELPDPVNFEASNEDILRWVTEAIQAGSVSEIPADPQASLTDFVVDRFAASDATPYNRLMIRPKVPFGS